MYHSISDEPEKEHPYYWINTSPKRFAEQMKFLHDNNYRVINLSEAVGLIMLSGSSQYPIPNTFPPVSNDLHPKPFTLYNDKLVVLTFDDGYLDFFEKAYPVLCEIGYSANVFLPTGCIDEAIKSIRKKKHMNWNQVRELSGHKITFGSHTVTHQKLAGLNRDEIRRELQMSKSRIEDQLATTICTFSYPYKYPTGNANLLKCLREDLLSSGYTCAVTTRIGSTNNESELFSLRRIPINDADDEGLFSSKLNGYYDWCYAIQRVRKMVTG
jgi:peptidoglycan/xylan/chitin deacetylase (PgdA/CDA1 family)